MSFKNVVFSEIGADLDVIYTYLLVPVPAEPYLRYLLWTYTYFSTRYPVSVRTDF